MNFPRPQRGWIWFVWAVLMLLSAWQIVRTPVVSDVSSFLPGPANSKQSVMLEQLRNGLSTRIMLVGLVGGDAKASNTLREQLQASGRFAWVANGDASGVQSDRDKLFAARYLLSPAVNASRFSVEGLTSALGNLQAELASSQSELVKGLMARDPTLESLELLNRVSASGQLPSGTQVWTDSSGKNAILLMETKAAGSDIEAHKVSIAAIREMAKSLNLSVEFGGAGYFNVMSHDSIGKDAERLSLVAAAMVAIVLLWVLRSPRFLALAVLPVVSGTVAGFAAVGLSAGSIHAVTIAFGVTLIGEAVDYAIYSFVQRDANGEHDGEFWQQLLLAVVTSLIGFAAMFFSGFQGLQQLGLFSIIGLSVAALCTRFLLPDLLPIAGLASKPNNHAWLSSVTQLLRRIRWALLLVSGLAFAWLVNQHTTLWNDSLDSLSSSSPQDDARDQAWRDSLGVPDLRRMWVVRGQTQEQALQRTEALTDWLDGQIALGKPLHYQSPSLLLPSLARQSARRSALPGDNLLAENLTKAAQSFKFKDGSFAPFLKDMQATRSSFGPGQALSLEYYGQGLLGHWLSSQIVSKSGETLVMVLLRTSTAPMPLEAALLPGVEAIDLQSDVESLVRSYRLQATHAAIIGALLIALVLAFQLRQVKAVASMLLTLVSTVVLTTAILVLLQGKVTVFNMVALLLVAGVASNYTLFFSTLSADPQERMRASLSVLLAATSTFLAFATLASSSTPVLAMIGKTVAIGAALGLFTSMVFSSQQRSDQNP